MKLALIDAASADPLRRAVLRPDLPAGAPLDGFDGPDALHVGALEAGRVVGTCMLAPAPYPLHPDVSGAWQLRAMAVDPARQGAGVGRRVVAFAVDELAGRGVRLLWCNARVTAVPFYERLGFTVEGDVFVTAATGLPHRRMWRELPAAATSSR